MHVYFKIQVFKTYHCSDLMSLVCITSKKLLQTWDLYLLQWCYTQKVLGVPNCAKYQFLLLVNSQIIVHDMT